MKALFTKIISLILTILAFRLVVSADSFMPPVYFEMDSLDGKRTFKWDPQLDIVEGTEAEVYENDQLIYRIEGLNNLGSGPFEFYFSNDMNYLARIPTVDQENAIYFYSQGQLVKKYAINELVKDMNQVTYSVTMAFWRADEDPKFDSMTNELSVRTVDNQSYVFDIETGDIIEQVNSNRSSTWILIGVSFLIVVGIYTIYRRKK